MNRTPAGLLADLRRIGGCDRGAVDAAIAYLSDDDIDALAGALTQLAIHLAGRVGGSRGLLPSGAESGSAGVHLDLAARPSAVAVAGMFVRYTLQRWRWGDVLVDAERIVCELVGGFVAGVESAQLYFPTRMTVSLRVLSERELVMEVRDSPDNAEVVARCGELISAEVKRVSARCGRHYFAGRTVLWAELFRPDLDRWR